MLVSIIAALDLHGLIGAAGGLPWQLPNDLRHFRACTWGKPIIMGRRTFASIGKPLPGRLNIVLTQNPDFSAPSCRIARTLPEALSRAEEYCATTGGDEAMIIGGGTVYAAAIERWDRMYLTLVEGDFQGGTYFPIEALLRQSWRPIGARKRTPPMRKIDTDIHSISSNAFEMEQVVRFNRDRILPPSWHAERIKGTRMNAMRFRIN